jgi:MFS family permease
MNLLARIRNLRIRDALGLERNVLVMTAAAFLQTVGNGLWRGYAPKMIEELGARGLAIGAVGTMGSVLWILFPYLGGMLSDRLGRGRAMILSNALAIGGYLVYIVAPNWWVYALGVVLTTAGASFNFMGSMALTGEAVDSDRRAASMATQGILLTVPAVLAPPIGGAILERLGVVPGVRVGLAITIVLVVIAVWLQRRYYTMPTSAAESAGIAILSTWRAVGTSLRRLLVANALVAFGMGMGASFIVLYALNVLKGSALTYGFLQSLQTLVTASLVLPAAKIADRAGQASRWPFVAATFVFSVLLPIAVIAAPSAAWLAVAFIVFGLREVGDTVRKALIVDLAEEKRRGSVIGLYFMIIGAVAFPAPLIGGWLWERSPVAPFIAGASVTTLGLLWFLWRVPRRQDADGLDPAPPSS